MILNEKKLLQVPIIIATIGLGLWKISTSGMLDYSANFYFLRDMGWRTMVFGLSLGLFFSSYYSILQVTKVRLSMFLCYFFFSIILISYLAAIKFSLEQTYTSLVNMSDGKIERSLVETFDPERKSKKEIANFSKITYRLAKDAFTSFGKVLPVINENGQIETFQPTVEDRNQEALSYENLERMNDLQEYKITTYDTLKDYSLILSISLLLGIISGIVFKRGD